MSAAVKGHKYPRLAGSTATGQHGCTLPGIAANLLTGVAQDDVALLIQAEEVAHKDSPIFHTNLHYAELRDIDFAYVAGLTASNPD